MLDPVGPSLASQAIDAVFKIVGDVDATKSLNFQVDTQATASQLTLDVGAQTASRTLFAPVLTANATLAVLSEAQTLTGAKTFSAALAVTDTTSSTNTATGCAKFSGGVGIGGDTFTGGNVQTGLDLAIPTNQRVFFTAARNTHYIRYSASSTASGFGSALAAGPGGDGVQFDSNLFTYSVANVAKVTFDNVGSIKCFSTVSSSSSITGALQVSGGVGIGGDLNIAGGVGVGTGVSTAGVLINAQAANNVNAIFRVTGTGGGGGFMQIGTVGGTVEYSTDTSGNLNMTINGVAANVFQMLRSGAVTGTLVLNSGAAIIRTDPGGSDVLRVGGSVNVSTGYKVSNTQVVGAQITGYGTPTGNSRLSAFPGATATLAQCSAQIAQMIIDLKTHGLYGA